MELTEKQFNEKYGEAEVVFAYYYKYLFQFIGEFEGKHININVGGDANDIYRLGVDPNRKYQVKELSINYAAVKEGGTTIDEYTDGSGLLL